MDSWIKYYRQDENTPNATVSYYTKGALVALCFDLTLRHEGKSSLDDVMRGLWSRCLTMPHGGTMSEADFAAVLAELGGRSYAPEIAAWVHGTAELPLKELLAHHGVALHDDPAQWAQRLGLRVAESPSLQVKMVLRGGAAEQAGFAAGDEWLGIETEAGGWRLHKVDDLPLYAGQTQRVTALVARDKRLLRLSLALPAQVSTARLALQDAALAAPWLAPSTSA
jgi:predicted metalloprotease with PDZ domain